MTITRELTQAEELALTTILSESEKSPQNITHSLNKISSDLFFIANVCARAFNMERYKNILCEIFSIIKPDQFSNLYEELLKLLPKTQVDLLFLTYTSESIAVRDWIIAHCRKDKNYSLFHLFAAKFASGNKQKNGAGFMLLIAVHEVPFTAKFRIDTIKNFLNENISFGGSYTNSTLKTFDHCVDLKDYEIISLMTESAFNHQNQENIQHIANGVARAIRDEKVSSYCNEVIKAVHTKLTTPSKDVLIASLRSSLTKEQANKYFLAHMNDNLPNETLDLLMRFGISPETFVTAIDTCTNIKNADVYLNQFLEQKPATSVLKDVIRKVINRSENSKDWRLAEVLASKIIPSNEDAYGDLLLSVTKSKQKYIAKKLIKANAKLNWFTNNEKKYALHFMIEHKWNDVLEEMLSNTEGIKLLADGIAQLLIYSSDNCVAIIKTVNTLLKDKKIDVSFYEALHKFLTQQQADEVFTNHVNDETWNVLNVLMAFGVSVEALIKNLENNTYRDDSFTYINKLLEKNLNESQLSQIMTIAINRFKKSGNYVLINQIISKQPNVPAIDKIYGKALLEVVSENKPQNDELIKKLIQANAFLDQQTDDTKNTALHIATNNGNHQLVSMLLQAGASADIKNKEQKSPEDLAIKNGDYYAAKLLRSKYIEKNYDDKYTVDQLNILYRLFINDDHALQLILNEDYLNKTKDEKGEPSHARFELSKIIFNTVTECKTQAILDNKIEIFTQLLKNNILKITPSELKEILSYQDENGNTALHIAAFYGHFNLVKLLLDLGANPSKVNNLGEIPLSLATQNKSLIIAKLLKTDSNNRKYVVQIANLDGINKLEQALQKDEPKITRTLYKALSNDHIATQQAINHCRYYNKYGRLMLLSAIGAMYSQLDLHFTSYRAEISDLKIEDLYWLRHGVSWSDKQKLKYLQEFLLNNLDAFRNTAKDPLYKNLNPLTLILLVMKQQLHNPTYKQIITKHKVESSLRSLMRDELGMSSEEINQQMDRSKYIVDKLLGIHQPELDQKVNEKESELLRAGLNGEIRGLRRMIDTYNKDTENAEFAKFRLVENFSPRYGRLMFFCAATAPFVGESDQATYFYYLKSLNPKTWFYEKNQKLALMKRFYLYSFELSKKLKLHYKINDPCMLIFLVLEHASKYKKFSDAEIKIINERLKASLTAAMMYEGHYTSSEIDSFITEKMSQISILLKSNPLEERIDTFMYTSVTPTDVVPVAQPVYSLLPPVYIEPSAPLMAIPVATEAPPQVQTVIPPLAEVVKLPEALENILPPNVELTREDVSKATSTASPDSQPEVINVSDNPSSFFSPSNPIKLPASVKKDLEYLELREQLLEVPLPPEHSLTEQNNVKHYATTRVEIKL